MATIEEHLELEATEGRGKWRYSCCECRMAKFSKVVAAGAMKCFEYFSYRLWSRLPMIPHSSKIWAIKLKGGVSTTTGGQKCMSFRTTQPSLKTISPTPSRSKYNIMPATQPTDTHQRNNTDKAAEALHYLVKLSLLGQWMVEIGASQAPQSESSSESKLGYPANTINILLKCWTLGSTIHSPTPIFARKNC